MKYILYTVLVVSTIVAGCYKESDYNKQIDTSVLKVYSDSLTLTADGYSILNLYASIPSDADDSLAQVTFRTTGGQFPDVGQQSITVPALRINDSVKVAQVRLKSSLIVDTINVFITARPFSYKKSLTISFVRSYPDKLVLVPSSFGIKPTNLLSTGGEVGITAMISKQRGKPSIGDTVILQSYDSLFKRPIGSFRIYNNTTDSNGITNFSYVLGDSVANHDPIAYTGKLYIIGTTKISPTMYISDTIQLISSR